MNTSGALLLIGTETDSSQKGSSSSKNKNGIELPPYSLVKSRDQEDFGTHELLITEADTILLLADEQYEFGFKFEAMLNYHTACVFYRVMETMIPSKATSIQHSRLMHAASVSNNHIILL